MVGRGRTYNHRAVRADLIIDGVELLLDGGLLGVVAQREGPLLGSGRGHGALLVVLVVSVCAGVITTLALSGLVLLLCGLLLCDGTLSGLLGLRRGGLLFASCGSLLVRHVKGEEEKEVGKLRGRGGGGGRGVSFSHSRASRVGERAGMCEVGGVVEIFSRPIWPEFSRENSSSLTRDVAVLTEVKGCA